MCQLQLGECTYIKEPYSILSYDCRKENGDLPKISVGNYCSIATNCTFILAHHNYKFVTTSPSSKNIWLHGQGNVSGFSRGDIIINNDVWIGANVTVLDNVTIGNGAVIGAGSIVTSDIPAYAIASGNPAKPIKYRFSLEQIDLLEKTEWWNFSRNIVEQLNPWTDNIEEFCKRCDQFRGL